MDLSHPYTYVWANAEHTSLSRTDRYGNVAYVPATLGKEPKNRDWVAYQESGIEADPYVPPAKTVPKQLTAEEKLKQTGLTVNELKSLLGIQ